MTKLSIWERTGILYGNKKPKHHKLGEHKIKQYTPNTSKLNKIDCRDVIKQLNTLNYNDVDSKIDDIFVGVSRLDLGGNTRPLSKLRLFKLVTLKDFLFLEDIQSVCRCEVRQARNYFKAVKMCVLFISNYYKSLNNDNLSDYKGSFIYVAENCNSDNYDVCGDYYEENMPF